MQKIFLVFFIMMFSSTVANAEIVIDYDYTNETKVKVSKISTPFNEALVLKYTFKYNPIKTNRIPSNKLSLAINLDPVNRKMNIQQIDIESDSFTYTIDGYCNNRKGIFQQTTSASNSVYGNGRYSIYGDNDTGYGIYEHSNKYSSGPSFSISFDYLPDGWIDYTSPETKSLYNDLLYAIKTNSQMVIKVPYIEGYGTNRETKHLTFWITKEVLSEWKDLMIQLHSEIK